MRITLFLFTILLVLGSACKNTPETVPENFEYTEIESSSKVVNEVLYSMYLPTDMAAVFSRSGTNYNPDLPASIENIELYANPEQIALMLGIYGVDITYMKLLDQSLPVAQYLKTIESLSEKVQIPASIFQESSMQLEKYFNNEDSLAVIIENIYTQTDHFFKESGNDNLAALSLFGGWIEAMYIGVTIFEANKGNNVIAERILQQKFSLNSIYTTLSNYQESLSVKEYLLMLKKLRKVFNNVEIRYQKEGFSVDTTQKKLQAHQAHIKYDKETMDELLRIIPLIREEIIAPKD